MNDITEMTAVMLSYLNGAKIEFRCIYSEEVWEPDDSPSWNWGLCDYRVAQEKRSDE